MGKESKPRIEAQYKVRNDWKKGSVSAETSKISLGKWSIRAGKSSISVEKEREKVRFARKAQERAQKGGGEA